MAVDPNKVDATQRQRPPKGSEATSSSSQNAYQKRNLNTTHTVKENGYTGAWQSDTKKKLSSRPVPQVPPSGNSPSANKPSNNASQLSDKNIRRQSSLEGKGKKKLSFVEPDTTASLGSFPPKHSQTGHWPDDFDLRELSDAVGYPYEEDLLIESSKWAEARRILPITDCAGSSGG